VIYWCRKPTLALLLNYQTPLDTLFLKFFYSTEAFMTVLYGIPNCDTIKKAKKWLTDHSIDFSFHDFRKDGLEKKTLDKWSKQVGWETLLNKRGTTWRSVEQSTKDNINQASALDLMLENPAMIKRPVLTSGDATSEGFQYSDYTRPYPKTPA